MQQTRFVDFHPLLQGIMLLSWINGEDPRVWTKQKGEIFTQSTGSQVTPAVMSVR